MVRFTMNFEFKLKEDKIVKGFEEAHCHAEYKQLCVWQKGLVGQCLAGLNLNYNFHCLIQ